MAVFHGSRSSPVPVGTVTRPRSDRCDQVFFGVERGRSPAVGAGRNRDQMIAQDAQDMDEGNFVWIDPEFDRCSYCVLDQQIVDG